MENNIIQINYQDKLITLIPTAHVSKNSAELVEKTIDELKPDSICIEPEFCSCCAIKQKFQIKIVLFNMLNV